MSVLEDLLLEAQELDKGAGTIQISKGLPQGSNWSQEDISQFVNRYHVWYANSLANLPEDLKEKFRAAYEAPPHLCIKRFLESPAELNYRALTNPGKPAPFGYLPEWKYPYDTSFRKPLFTQKQILIEVSKRPSEPKAQTSIEALAMINRLARNFHVTVSQLNQRHNKRAPLITIQDEYDVQDFFHVLISPFFDDIRPEEYCPSYAGGSSRIDFLLKTEQVIIEIKKARKGLEAKEIGEQLIVDIARYRSHPDCKTLVAFVYDPDKKVTNPKGLENDLSRISDGINVQVIVNQG